MTFWSDSENQRFENAIALYDEGTPRRWELVAAMVGGGKTAADVIAHYAWLEHDVGDIAANFYRQQLLQQQQHVANGNPNNTNNAHNGNPNYPNGNATANGTAGNSNNHRRGNNSGAGSSNNRRGNNRSANQPGT